MGPKSYSTKSRRGAQLRTGESSSSNEIPTLEVEESEEAILVEEELSEREYRLSDDIPTKIDKISEAPNFLEEEMLGNENLQYPEAGSDDETESHRSLEGEATGETRIRGSFTGKLLPITPTHPTWCKILEEGAMGIPAKFTERREFRIGANVEIISYYFSLLNHNPDIFDWYFMKEKTRWDKEPEENPESGYINFRIVMGVVVVELWPPHRHYFGN